MFGKLCNLLCSSQPAPLQHKDVEVAFSKKDIAHFESHIKNSDSINFLHTFFYYKRDAREPETHFQNTLFKILLLEHFVSSQKFLAEISSLSENGIRGYLLVDSKIIGNELIIQLLTYSQKRAAFMLNCKAFRRYIRGDPIISDKSFSRKVNTAMKLKKYLHSFGSEFLLFPNNYEATAKILDYRLFFYNKLAKLCAAYLVLLCASCHLVEPEQLYPVVQSIWDVKAEVENVNTIISLALTEEANKNFVPLEIDPQFIREVEKVVYSRQEKNSFHRLDEEQLTECFEKIITLGLRAVKDFKVLRDRHQFSRLEAFVMQRVEAKNKLAI